jgi:hypothetical protein
MLSPNERNLISTFQQRPAPVTGGKARGVPKGERVGQAIENIGLFSEHVILA